MGSFHLFIILLLSSNFYQLIKSNIEDVSISISPWLVDSDTNETIVESITIDTKTNSTSVTTTSLIVNITVNATDIAVQRNETISSITTTSELFPLSNVTSTELLTTTLDLNDNRSTKSKSRSRWWLITSAIVAFVVIIIIAFIYYRRQRTSYSRFLENWQPRDDGADNMTFQLEESDISYREYPQRLVLT